MNLGRYGRDSRRTWAREQRLAAAVMLALGVSLAGCGAAGQAETRTTPPTATATSAPTATSTPTPAPTTDVTPSPLPPTIPAHGWATYRNTAYHFSLEYPANWLTPDASATANNFSVYNFDPRQFFEPTITPPLLKLEVDAAPNPSRLSPADFFAVQQSQPGQAGPVGTPATSSATVAGRQALRVVLTYPGTDFPPIIRYFVPAEQTMFILSADTPNGQPAPEFSHLVASFSVTG